MGFPNFRNKHKQDAMFSPQDFLNYQKKTRNQPKVKLPKGIIICYQKDLMKFILKNHETTRIKEFHGDFYTFDEMKGKLGIVGNFGIGAPVAVTVFEELVASGVKKFLSIGTAGTLQKNIKIGDLMICNRAIRDEGTSYHYLKKSKYSYASSELTEKLKQILEKNKQKYFVGTSWTIDAPYRETVAEAKKYQKQGVVTVDMEASALFAVAEYRNVELGSIFTISDSLSELEWKPRFYSKKTNMGLEKIYKIALEVLSE